MPNSDDPKSALSRPQFLAVTCVLLVAALLRLLYFREFIASPYMFVLGADEKHYLGLAHDVLSRGFWRGAQSFMDPFYGDFLALVHILAGEGTAIARLIQISIDCLNVWLLYLLGRRLHGHHAGILGAALYACYGPALHYSVLLLKPILASFLILIYVHAYLSSRGQPWWRWTLPGSLGALAGYLQSNLFLLVPLTLSVLLIDRQVAKPDRLRASFFLLAGFSLVLAVGTVRNHQSTGMASPFPVNAGAIAFIANQPGNLTGEHKLPAFAASPHPAAIQRDFQREAELRAGHHLTPSEASRFWARHTLESLLQHPGQVLPRLGGKIARLLADYETPNNRSFAQAREQSQLLKLPLATFGLVLALGLPGLAWLTRTSPPARILLVPIAITALSFILFLTLARLRFPIVPLLCLGSGVAISQFVMKIRMNHLDFRLVATGLVSAGIFIISMMAASRSQEDKAHDDISLADAFARMGQLDRAQEELQKVPPNVPGAAKAYLVHAAIALRRNDHPAAIRHGEIAIRATPDNAAGHFNLGLAYLLSGHPHQAEARFQSAAGLDPDAESYFFLALALDLNGKSDAASMAARASLGLAHKESAVAKAVEAWLGGDKQALRRQGFGIEEKTP